MIDLSGLVKAYDVRGTVPDQLNAGVARALGAAFVAVTGATRLVADRIVDAAAAGERDPIRLRDAAARLMMPYL